MTWALILLFCAGAVCRPVPLPMPGDGYRSYLACMTDGQKAVLSRGATRFVCRSRMSGEVEA